MADLGTLFVSIDADTKKFDKAINNTEKKTTNLGKSFKKFGEDASRFVTLPILAIGTASLKLASDAEETNAKFNTAFKGIEDRARETADRLSDNFGLATLTAEKLLSGTGDLIKGFGATADEALNISNTVQELSVDLASYNNLQGGATRASEILTKAFLGERDALTSLGIKISEEDVKQQLFLKGQEDLTGQALLLAKGQATLEIALRQSGDAVGDYARTSESAANQARLLVEEAKELAVSFGRELLPAATQIVKMVTDAVQFFTEMDDSLKSVIISVAGFAAVVGPAIKLVTALKIAFVALSGPVGIVVTALAGVVAGVKALQELKLAQLEGQFGELSKETGLTIEQIDFANTRLNQFINQTDDVGESLLLVAKDTGIAYNELVKLVAISENLTEEERALYQQRADNIRKFEGEYQAFTEEYDEQNQKQLDSTTETVDEAIDKILELTDTEIEALEEREQRREELNLANQERLNTAFATDLERLQLKKEAEILNAQELGASVFEIEQFYALEKIRVQDEQKAKEIADQEEITKKIEEENQKRQAFILSTTDSIIGIVNNLQQVELNNLKTREQEQIEALDRQALGEEAYAAEVEKIQKETAREQYRIEKQQFEANKALSLIEIAINTAVGVSKALAQGGIFGIATGALVTAAGVAQAALVSSQPPPPRPALATGGIIPESRRGVDVTVGEAGSRGDIVLGAGAKGKALRDLVAGDMANTMMAKMGGQQKPIVINLYGRSLVSKSELDQFARDLRPALVREDQRRGVLQ